MRPKIINSNLTGPIEGTFPVAAKILAGENMIIRNIKSLFPEVGKCNLKSFFICLVLT